MKIFKGIVKSKKMEKTATVEVVRLVAHPIYIKRYKRTRVYHVHDEIGTKVGQKVKFVTCRPYSKSKRWKIVEVEGGSDEKKSSKSRAVKKKGTRRKQK